MLNPYARISHESLNTLLSDRSELLRIADELSAALSARMGPHEADFAQIEYADLKSGFQERSKTGVY